MHIIINCHKIAPKYSRAKEPKYHKVLIKKDKELSYENKII